MFFRSIRWRLQLWHGLTLVVVLAGFGFTVFRLQHAHELRRVDEEIEQRASVLLRTLREGRPAGRPPPEEFGLPGRPGQRPPPGGFRLPPEHAGLFGDGAGFYYVIWRRDGQPLGRSTNASDAVPIPPAPATPGPDRGTRARGLFREGYHFTPPGECILVGRSIAPEEAGLRRFALTLTGLGAGVLVLGLAGGWWVATRAIRPIDDISATAAKISTGDLSHRINAADTESELGQLAGVLNSTFARLEAAFAQQQQFTADASHELRTPVSVILSQTQSALARERPATEYRETLEACQRAAQRMRRLIESLLALARLDAGHEQMKREPLDLARTAAECLELVRPLAAERRIALHADFAPAPASGDAERLAQVMTNLLTNAIHHNREGGAVRVVTRAENGHAVLTVSDTGPGVPAEHLPRIFDRFYRADAARTAAQGRAGLGLAISKAIIEAHGGSIEAASPPGGGATFTVRLPLGG